MVGHPLNRDYCALQTGRDARGGTAQCLRGTGSGRVRPMSEFPLHHFLTMGSWANHLISLGLSLCTCKMGIIIVSLWRVIAETDKEYANCNYCCFGIFHCISNTFWGEVYTTMGFCLQGPKALSNCWEGVMRLYIHFADGEVEAPL